MTTPKQENRQKKFELTITADRVESTDSRFTMDNLGLGDSYEPLTVYFKRATGGVVKRALKRSERKISNQTMPRLAFQIFEKQIDGLSDEEKASFPIYKERSDKDTVRGIFSSVEEFKKYRNSMEYMKPYNYGNGQQFVIYCWNVFSSILFVQECLKRFGKPGDRFVLTYREKDGNAKAPSAEAAREETIYRNPYSSVLIESKNLIFRGAPGTGKSYLAKKIAADIVSNGNADDYSLLTDKQKAQVEFVQFHPSYDYTDFVEGLRPKINADGTMGFELREGIFKKFVERARNAPPEQKYIFIIDEINRGEISKIFGELFFSIDPGYRGKSGEISTQYSNLHSDPNEKFYVPENVYIIGTMNDIDRSVDSFDFAMRRRFRFVELKANEQLAMLASLGEELEAEATARMTKLNEKIASVEDLNENYQIGAAYFLKLKTLDPDRLWSDYLAPLLRDYVQGMHDEENLMKQFAEAYRGDANDDAQDQG